MMSIELFSPTALTNMQLLDKQRMGKSQLGLGIFIISDALKLHVISISN